MFHRLHLLFGICAALLCSMPALSAERLEPGYGCFLGFSIDTSVDTVAALNQRLGFNAALLTQFAEFPLRDSDRAVLDNMVDQVLPAGAMLMITLEPVGGLATVTAQACDDFTALCAAYERRGVTGILVRFAHEMNGPWYVWGQKPALYIEKFRLLDSAIHAGTQHTAMLWAPNDGGGYPYGGHPAPGDFAFLDTNHDGILDMADDMYTPFYPGDDAADWVGLTLYHWGNAYPWGENELPEPRSFADKIMGNYNGANGDNRPVPDFYAMFCGDSLHRKPMAIAETAAFFNTQRAGAAEFDIKQRWWRQVFDISGDDAQALDIAAHFPQLKLINWLEWRKAEKEVNNDVVDWRVTQEPQRTPFVYDIQKLRGGRRYFLSARDIGTPATDPPPVAPLEFISPPAATPNPAHTGDGIQFSAAANGIEPLTIAWDFGDGSQGPGSPAFHTYSSSGSYDVRVDVMDAGGRSLHRHVALSVTRALIVDKFACTLHTSQNGRDTCLLQATLPSEALSSGSNAHIDLGGISGDFMIQANNRVVPLATMTGKSKLKFMKSKGRTRFSFTFSGNIAERWIEAAFLTSEKASVPVELTIGNETYSAVLQCRIAGRSRATILSMP
jgi:hypothetical protein